MRYHYTWLDSVEREGDVDLSSDVLHSEAEMVEASERAYRIAQERNLASPEVDEDGEPYPEDDGAPDDSQVLHILVTEVLPDLEYVERTACVSMPRGGRA